MRINVRTVSLDDLAFFVHDKLGEVPLDEVTQHTALLFLQIRPERMRVAPVYVYLLEQVEFHLRARSKNPSEGR